MSKRSLGGVIAAIPTPFLQSGAPDLEGFVRLARHLLENGCDGLNVLGTTGEATSLSVEERISVMRTAADALPLERLMVGTGAASVTDAKTLTREAADCGFAGALVLPPFYYKSVQNAGVLDYVEQVAEASRDSAIPIYLYNFPALSGVPYTLDLIVEIRARIGTRLAGIKDSSGDLPYCRAVAGISPDIAVFPATEAALAEARTGIFAGCISATANVNSDLCARAYHDGDSEALEKAVAIRGLFKDINVVSGVKGLLSDLRQSPPISLVRPPLVSLSPADCAALAERARSIRAGRQ